MDRVGLQPEHYNRYPHEFSGGQRQRIGIARALALRPKLIIADEPVSALDVSIQAQIINLLEDLQDEFDLSYIFVAHDLGVVRHVSDRIAVMYLGKIVERSPAACSTSGRSIPTRSRCSRRCRSRTRRRTRSDTPVVLEGDVPSPVDPPSACRFHTRCPWATEICSEDEPPLAEYGTGQAAACHHPRNVDAKQIAGPRSPRTARSPPASVLPGAEQTPPRLLDSLLRVLALDYGTARCGCAISDPTGTLVRPLAAVEPPDPAADRRAGLRERGRRAGDRRFADHAGGRGGRAGRLSRAFAAELTELLDVPVETYDERLTTRMADRSAREGARADRDSLAAAHLLESYFGHSQGEERRWRSEPGEDWFADTEGNLTRRRATG